MSERMKNFDKWNEVKKNIENKNLVAHFKEREVYWTNIGENVGFEQNGKGSDFTRPVLIFKKFSKTMFFGIPLSTKSKQGSFYFEFSFLENQISTALLVQAKMYDVKRLDKKIGTMKKEDFLQLKNKFGGLFGYEVLPQEDLRASPEGKLEVECSE
jgi:mRNA-degrading endonuclease toxin of MazEF toxin-antitoxin module